MAIGIYARQLDDPKHPEHIVSACREIERCLRDALDERETAGGDLLPIDEVAKRPIAAARVLGFLLDGAAVVDYERWPYNSDAWDGSGTVNRVREHLARSRDPKLLAQLAEAVGREQTQAQVESWQPQLLAILGWAATENGAHEQAVRLCERSATLLAKSDDLQYCRGVALQRAGRNREAAAALRALRESFPQSRLTSELSLRIAKILHHLKNDAAAHAELTAAMGAGEWKRPNPSEPASPEPRIHFHDELEQWDDVLQNFLAPAEREKLARARQPDGKLDIATCRSVLMIHLSTERWKDVERMAAELASLAKPETDEKFIARPEWVKLLSDREYAKAALELAELHKQLRGAKRTEEKADLSWKIAQTWEKHRGMLTLEQDAGSGYMHADFRNYELHFRVNAQALGFPLKTTNRMLETRDELRRTHEHALRTADLAPRTPLAAQALHKANECLKRMAEVSPYAQARAFEADWSGQSRKLYDRLRKECADSPESQRLAAWWTFAPPGELHEWMPGNSVPCIEDDRISRAIRGTLEENPDYNSLSEAHRKHDLLYGSIRNRILALPDLGLDGKLDEMRAECVAIRRDMQPLAENVNWFVLVSALDEVELLSKQPSSKFETLGKYLKRLLEGSGSIPSQGGDDKDPLADLYAYRRVLKGPDEWSRAPWSVHEEHWRNFLQAHPDTIKREAAEFQLARSIVRQHRGWVHAVNHDWPDAPFTGRYIGMSVNREKEFDAASAKAALDAYEKAYPQARYAADVRLMRGGIAVDAGDYVMALKLICETLDDETHPELHADAARNLAQCFERLHEPEQRMALARAIAANDSALERFRRFARSPTCGQRLRVMEAFVMSVKS